MLTLFVIFIDYHYSLYTIITLQYLWQNNGVVLELVAELDDHTIRLQSCSKWLINCSSIDYESSRSCKIFTTRMSDCSCWFIIIWSQTLLSSHFRLNCLSFHCLCKLDHLHDWFHVDSYPPVASCSLIDLTSISTNVHID